MTAIALDQPARSESLTWRRFKDAFRRHPTAIVGGHGGGESVRQ